MVHLYSSVIFISLVYLLPNRTAAKSTGGQVRPAKSDQTKVPSQSGISFRPLIIPEKCKKIGICDDIEGYPDNYVARLVEKILEINSTKFNVDKLEIGIQRRFGSGDDYFPMCQSYTEVYSPKAALNVDDNWYYIINNEKKKAEQKFVVNICSNSDVSCSNEATFPLSYKSTCRQDYMLRKMLALDYNGKPFEEYFMIPSCCSCVFKQTNVL